MENEKNNNGYDNESYLNKREDPKDALNNNALDEIKNKEKEKPNNPLKENSKTNPIENADDNKTEDSQKEMHPEIGKKKSKDYTIPLILGVVVLIIIGIVAAYFLMDKEDEQQEVNHQQIIKSAMQEMNSVKSYTFKGDMNISVNSGGNLPDEDDSIDFSMAIKFDGQNDQSDLNNIKSSFNINPEINISTIGGNEDISFDFSTMSFGKVSEQVVYCKLNDFDLGATGLIYGKMIVPYKNKWYFLDMKELQEMNGVSMEENDFDFEKMMEKIMELYRKYEMIKFKSDLGDTEINGQKAYHYQVEIDSEATLDFYVELLKIMSAEIASVTGDDSMINENFDAELGENKEEILAIMDEFLSNVKTEIWIGKKDKMIYKIDLKGNYYEEYLSKIFDRWSLSKAKAEAQDAATKLVIQQTNIDLIIYGDNNGSFEGYNLDSSKVSVLHNSEINIKTNENSYVIWAELGATTGKWCCDSNNKIGFVSGDIEGTQCPDTNKEPQEEKNSNTELSFDMNITMSNFNKPVEIIEPEEAENFMEVLNELGKFMGARIAGIDTDLDGLSDEMETIYGSDPNNPDTDGDGYTDGEEVGGGFDPLIPGDARLDYDKLFKM